MYVNAHSMERIRARLSPADRGGKTLTMAIVAALESVPGQPGSIAVQVHRWPRATHPDGDQLVVIARDGEVCTVMLRRSWNQPFTPAALGVDRVLTVCDTVYISRSK